MRVQMGREAAASYGSCPTPHSCLPLCTLPLLLLLHLLHLLVLLSTAKRCADGCVQTYPKTRHIAVQRGSAIYKVDVLNEKFLYVPEYPPSYRCRVTMP